MRHALANSALPIFALVMISASSASKAQDAPATNASQPVHAAAKSDGAAEKNPTAPIELVASAPVQSPRLAKLTALRSLPPEVRQFCTNNAAAAGEARVAWQAAKLTELDTKLQQRIAELAAKQAEYETWLKKREDMLKRAQDDVVAIYAKMAPEAAATQLAAMDDDVAAAVLIKLNSRTASAILAEMDPDKAAHLANAMIAPETGGDGKKS
jgi:flagellar motility protein MotE (MotC chaperone)